MLRQTVLQDVDHRLQKSSEDPNHMVVFVFGVIRARMLAYVSRASGSGIVRARTSYYIPRPLRNSKQKMLLRNESLDHTVYQKNVFLYWKYLTGFVCNDRE